MPQKVRKQGITFWDLPKVGIKLFYNLSHARIFSRPKILFVVSLLFVALLNSIPTYLFEFLPFYHSSV